MGIHNQLQELHQLDAVHTADVDRTNRLLPRDVSVNWLRLYRDLTQDEKLKPFPAFMKFLRAERAIVARLVEYSPPYNKRDKITSIIFRYKKIFIKGVNLFYKRKIQFLYIDN